MDVHQNSSHLTGAGRNGDRVRAKSSNQATKSISMAPHRVGLIRVGVIVAGFVLDAGQGQSTGVAHHGDEDVLHLGAFRVPAGAAARRRRSLPRMAE